MIACNNRTQPFERAMLESAEQGNVGLRLDRVVGTGVEIFDFVGQERD